MKRCSQCNTTYPDTNADLQFCLLDGTPLIFISNSPIEEPALRPSPFVQQTLQSVQPGISPAIVYSLITLLALIVGGGIVFLLKPMNEASSVPPSKVDYSTSTSDSNQLANETVKNPTANQNTINIRNSENQTPLITQPTSDYSTKNVRAGTADGKRLRVVVDLARTDLNTGNPVGFETLASVSNGETRVFVKAQTDNFLNVKYESKQARKLGTVVISPSGQGLEIKVIPQNRLYLKDVFFIPRSPVNPNDRLVIDLCVDENCPSLRT